MMDTVLVISGLVLLAAGLVGCFIPFLIGPPLGFVGMLLVHFTAQYQFSAVALVIMGILAVLSAILDNIFPVLGATRTGGSKRAAIGSAIGAFAGIFVLPPFGILLGAFVGAFIGEITGGKEAVSSFKSSFGVFLGFIAGLALKLFSSVLMIFWCIRELAVK